MDVNFIPKIIMDEKQPWGKCVPYGQEIKSFRGVGA